MIFKVYSDSDVTIELPANMEEGVCVSFENLTAGKVIIVPPSLKQFYIGEDNLIKSKAL